MTTRKPLAKQPVVDGPEPLWLCTECQKAKPVVAFYSRPGKNKRGLSPQCRECIKAVSQAWYAANKAHRQETKRAYRERIKHEKSQ